MIWRRILFTVCALALTSGCAQAHVPERFLGRWDMTLHTPGRDYYSWLEVTQEKGKPRVRLVSRWGHARWIKEASIRKGKLHFVSPAADEGLKQDLVFEARVRDGQLTGTAGNWTFEATRAPALHRAASPQWAQSESLFDGASLTGWHPRDYAAKRWQVENGLLVTPGSGGSDLISNQRFTDFKLHAEFRVAPGANSGIYLRGRYEVQVEDDRAPEGPSMRTGGVYGYLAPAAPAPRESGTWHAYDITLIGRRVTVVLDGRTLIADKEIPGLTGGALSADEGAPGPIMLQGSESGRVEYRNIVITPAANAAGSKADWALVWDDEFDHAGAPDPAKWSFEAGGDGGGNGEQQFYTNGRPHNARVEGGNLVIEANREPWHGKAYTSARLITRGKGDWRYGRFEIRAKFSEGRGTWPAIWMMPSEPRRDGGDWPDNGEIDIMEHVGFDPGVVHGSAHSLAFQWPKKTERTATVHVTEPDKRFHVYTLEWEPDTMRMYVDGALYFATDRAGGDWREWPFDRKFYLILNLAVGGSWGGQKGVDAAAFPQRTVIDYVRVYQRANEAEGVANAK